MERLLRLIQYLSSTTTRYTLDEIAKSLDTSKRSLFRYIDTLKSAGFSVTRVGEGVYQMTTYNKEFSDLSQLVYFTDEEAIIVSHLIENLDGTNALKAGLRKKLAAVYDSTSISDYAVRSGKSEIIDLLADAVKLFFQPLRRNQRLYGGALQVHQRVCRHCSLRHKGRHQQTVQDFPYGRCTRPW